MGFDQAFLGEDVGDARHGGGGFGGLGGRRRGGAGGEQEIQQAVGVVVGRAEQLAAGEVFVDGGDAAAQRHRGGIDRGGVAEAGQGGAVGAQQEGGFDQVALRLFDCQGGEFGVVERAFGHHPIHRAAHLLLDLRQGEVWHRRVAAPGFGEPGMGVVDGAFATFDRDIGHIMPPRG